MHNRLGPWHTLDVTELPGGRNYSFTHPGHPKNECPDDCELQADLASHAIELIDDRFGNLPFGQYRIRSEWYSGRLENLDGTEITYPDPLADIQPLNLDDLDDADLDALVNVGNAERNRYYHQRACGCSEYPHGCTQGIANGVHDTDAFGISLRHILAAYDQLRAS